MPIPTGGTGVQVGLIPDPFAHQLAHFSQMSRFDFADASIDPRTLLNDPNPNDRPTFDFGVNVILLNSVSRPLKLVDSVCPPMKNNSHWIDYQVCYPTGSLDGTQHDHEIPAARPYPVQTKHLQPNGAPALLAGVGFYRFDVAQGGVTRALSFSVGDRPALVGVHVRLAMQSSFVNRNCYACVAVTADVEKEYTSLDNFVQTTLTDPRVDLVTKPVYSTSANDRGALTVWGAPHPRPAGPQGDGTNSVVVWVRDAASTTGL